MLPEMTISSSPTWNGVLSASSTRRAIDEAVWLTRLDPSLPDRVMAPVRGTPAYRPLLARLLTAPFQILANPFAIIGPDGWLIGDAVRDGGDGGILWGNGAPGKTPGQKGGSGGIIFGNGADGADGGRPRSALLAVTRNDGGVVGAA